jgi:hypothetical protein
MDSHALCRTVTCTDRRGWTCCLVMACKRSGVRIPIAPQLRSIIRKFEPLVQGEYSSKVPLRQALLRAPTPSRIWCRRLVMAAGVAGCGPEPGGLKRCDRRKGAPACRFIDTHFARNVRLSGQCGCG